MRRELVAAFGMVLLFVAGAAYFYWSAAEAARQAAEEAEADRAHRVPIRPDPRQAEPRRTPSAALAKGVAYLLKLQSPDGAWRSDVYATFKDGPALTPLVVCALQEAGASGLPEASTLPVTVARRKGSEYLAKLIKPDGSIDAGEDGLDYPVYTASLAVRALSHPANKDLLAARDAWLKYLLDRQLTEKLGWKPEDKEFGGWGYCRAIPQKPEPNTIAPPLIESNLSATVFALDALRAASVTDKAVYEKALVFVRRCQNEDGGFHFIYDDPVRNKAGAVLDAMAGLRPPRFYSYGSTTADGGRALRLCGLPPDDPAARSAHDWLTKHFRADRHPGTYAPQHEPNRDAVYYYYAASASKALRAAGVKEAGGKPWAGSLAAELAKRQQDDGSWTNPVELVRENDPVVATASAVIALANCAAAEK
jgi:squalene-hopene/tetraprenyl-beta-curcumene cyclase